MIRRTLLIGAAAGLALACAQQGSSGAGSPQSKSHVRKHQVIRISDGYVRPEQTRIPADGGVTWINMSATHMAQVVFPMSIRDSLTCDDVRPRWNVASETIRSMPVGMDAEDLVLPCGHGSGHGALKPGEYSYEVWMYLGGLGGQFGNPEFRRKAKLIVE